MATPFYQLAPAIEQLFLDVDTQQPLAGGYVAFYNDNDRSTLKNIYQQTGTPGAYTYTPISQSLGDYPGVLLNQSGAFNTAIYYYPYDAEGNIELYYVTVVNANGVPQGSLTREGWPSVAPVDTNLTTPTVNYIPNGQLFINYNNTGALYLPETPFAPQMTFIRPAGSTAVDTLTIDQINEYTTNPSGNTRNASHWVCSTIDSGDTVKGFRIKFPNVNFLASTTNPVTFSIQAISNSGSALANCNFTLVKNFGTGGTPQLETLLSQFNINPGVYGQYYISFTPGSNNGQTIGTQGDDFLAIDIRVPGAALGDVSVTNYALSPGNLVNPAYPETNGYILTAIPLTSETKTFARKLPNSTSSSMPTVPRGWLLEDGTPYLRTSYPELLWFGTIYKTGTVTNNSYSYTGDTTDGSNCITSPSSIANLTPGMLVSGTGIPANTYIIGAANVAYTGNTVSGYNIISGMSSTANLSKGLIITGSGISAGAYIVYILNATSCIISQPATATATAVALTVDAIAISQPATATATAVALTFTSTSIVLPDTIGLYASTYFPMQFPMQLTASNFTGIPNITHILPGAAYIYTGTLASSSRVVTALSSEVNLVVGMAVSGVGIPLNTTIFSIDSGTQITLSQPATAAIMTASLTFTTASTTIVVNTNATTQGAINALFYRWGAGDGSTTFNVPNLSGRVKLNAGTNPITGTNWVEGQSGGEEGHIQTTDELALHVHPPLPSSGNFVGDAEESPNSLITGDNLASHNATTGSTGYSVPFNVLNPYIVANSIIKT